MATLSEIQVKQNNNTFLDMLESSAFNKQAADDASDYIRLKLREEGFARKIIEPTEVSSQDLDEQVWTDKPVKIYQKETDIQPAISVGYSAQPINFYIRPSKFAVTPTTILSPRINKNKWELRTYKYDVRQVFADNIVKDMQGVEDRAMLNAVNTALVGRGSNMPGSGVPQYVAVAGGFSRSSVATACTQVLQKTPYNIPVETVLINNITYAEHLKWQRDEFGGDGAEKNLTQGWKASNLLGLNWLVTIKRGLVPDYTQYMFGPTKFLGKTCLFTPPTMYVEVKNVQMYSFYCIEEIGSVLAHTGAFGRVDYLTS